MSPAASPDLQPRPASDDPTIALVSLGCPKALVDSERILTQLRAEGYRLTTQDIAGAQAVIVNTCGFLDSAKAESLAAIAEALEDNGRVIVTGCYGAEEAAIRTEFPQVLAVTGPQQYEQVVDAVHAAVPRPHDPYTDLVPEGGLKLTPRHYAYVKISEGCNHRCRFCIIPAMRGDLASRPAQLVLREAERLANAGVKELLIVSQDTSAYGVDLRHASSPWRGAPVRAHITDLANRLGDLGVWVRLHYIYPYPHVDQLIPLMAQGRILPYLDIPFQHGSPEVLGLMKRPAFAEKTLDRIAAWRRDCPDLTLRSTFIVGFPGETEAHFQELLDWLDAAEIDHAGCFQYEDVAGAAANDLPGHVPEAVKEERWHRFMAHQQGISRRRRQRWVGRVEPVLIDSVDLEEARGRTRGDAPEIDGAVIIEEPGDLNVGDLVPVRIEEASDYDLYGSVVTGS